MGKDNDMRLSGMLLPISALPSNYGIGCFSKEAYEFVDTLKKCGQSLWQILPLGPTGYGDSPYQSFSTFAGNPYFIDLETLVKDGLLGRLECEGADFGTGNTIDYEKMFHTRYRILHMAYQRAVTNGITETDDYHSFVKKNESWLPDYALFMALKDANHGKSWSEWEEGIRNRRPEALEEAGQKYKTDIGFYEFVQYEFFRQWDALKKYANEQGIQIIGDIPIYVAFDSADTWSAPEMFRFNDALEPIDVAGCPPDGFSQTGQLWGNPLYDWEYHKKTGYDWWIRRIEHCFRLYDVVRIDHFRGFDEYYAVPYGEKTAVHGKWMPGPGIELFRTLEEKIGRKRIIAEDLGFLTPSVIQLLKESGFPGMKVLQFAFDSREDSNYLPHTYTRNCVVYTGTHDNDTTKGWYHTAAGSTRQFAKEYMYKPRLDEDTLAGDFIAMAMGSAADLCIVPMQDYLGLGSDARINTPSTLGGNWEWRMKPGEPDEGTVREMERMTKIYGRLRFT